jgi:hypothetical protein
VDEEADLMLFAIEVDAMDEEAELVLFSIEVGVRT